MRQFLLGSTAYPSGAVAGNSSYGNVGFAYVDKSDNKMKFTATGEEIDVDGEGYLVLLRKDEDMGNVVLPLHKNHFSYVKGVFDNSKSGKFSAEFTITEVDPFLDYTVIVVKKGKLFNERNKWTATVHSKVSDTPETIATKLADCLNKNIGADVTASASSATVTIEGKTDNVDYKIVLADELIDTEVENVVNVMPPYGDVKYIIDLANRAAADAGFEYTYQDDLKALYPKYPLDPLAGDPSEDTGYTIFTIRCAEPRDMKTRDEVVHQIIQVAFPTGSAAIETFETVCKHLSDPSRNLYAAEGEGGGE